MKKYSLPFLLLALWALSCKKERTPEQTWALYDIDRNGYDTVKIGIQFWMKQNLNTSHYRNGDPIPEITSSATWASLTTGAWRWYNNDSANYAATYGKLYNWYAVNDPRGLAPLGWHVPAQAEWTSLITTLGGPSVAGSALKETGNAHWASPNTDATNSSRFTALPGGLINNIGLFFYQGQSCSFWSSTLNNNLPSILDINFNKGDVFQSGSPFTSGNSVRCIRN